MGKHRWPTVGDQDRADHDSVRFDVSHAEDSVPGVQWRVARSAALAFLGVALAIGGGLFLVRGSEPSAAAVTVQLDAEPSAGARQEATADDGPPGNGSSAEAQEAAETHGPSAPSDAEWSAGEAASPEVVVYVTGAVASPGVVTVAGGTRLFEVIDRAGGALPEADLEGINLAATPSDGEHIHLLAIGEEPRPGVPVGGGPASGAPGQAQGGQAQGGQASGQGGNEPAATIIDLNTATLAEIELLPRIGPVLGQRIIGWREEHGPFRQASDLDAVPGIGPTMLEGILPLVTVR